LARGAPLHPPAPPQVAPVISTTYPGDRNGDRINDDLEGVAARRSGISITGQAHMAGRMIPVQLVFREPVTQEQIDVFLALGGEITYLFKAISYGWNGRIPREQIMLLPAMMGATLVQVEPSRSVRPYLDLATQTGRVRPIWRPGFANDPCGFHGDPNTTIAFVDTGVDGAHSDLRDRCVYWRDFSDDNEPSPVDYDGHGTLCAGAALGTGKSAGAEASPLCYTSFALSCESTYLVEPISLPPGVFSDVTTLACVRGNWSAIYYVNWKKGTLLEDFDWTGASTLHLGVTKSAIVLGMQDYLLSTVVIGGAMWNIAIVTRVESYPGVGDGFPKFSGVAPGCRWAAVKIESRDGVVRDDHFPVALDDLVVRRARTNIKIISISYGLTDENGLPIESVPLRDEINTVVNNGIIVVSAAGNGAGETSAAARKMADPPRAGMVITVGGVDDENILTSYSSAGFYDPRENEDYKPDVLAPGGSILYTAIMSADSGNSDGAIKDQAADDYRGGCGTSLAAPFVAGCAALVIEAMERQGVVWDFSSSVLPRYVKMLLCATASETNAKREVGSRAGQPTLQRAEDGPDRFASGKDPYEGYGMINPDAAVEAVCQGYEMGSSATVSLGSKTMDKRVWARTTRLTQGRDIRVTLDNAPEADFDLYLYSMVPGRTGTPVILASSTNPGAGADESLNYSPASDMGALLVVKRVSGAGTAAVHSVPSAPPVAQDVFVAVVVRAATPVTLGAIDDGTPIPPGALTYTVVSLPEHGRLEQVEGGAPISEVPATLPTNRVVYRPQTGWEGPDSFTFRADDGGRPPYAGPSNVATVHITVQRQITLEYQVSAGADDAWVMRYSSSQDLNGGSLCVGTSTAGMRFRDVVIPQGALIKSATLSICSYTYGLTGTMQAKIRAEAADNPTDLNGRRVSILTGTVASQTWNWSDIAWTADTWYESPDIRQVVQEIVDRPGWAPGNAIVILYVGGSYEDDRRFWSYDGAPDKAPRLKITYEIE
jgi:subtilisin family serine protease